MVSNLCGSAVLNVDTLMPLEFDKSQILYVYFGEHFH